MDIVLVPELEKLLKLDFVVNVFLGKHHNFTDASLSIHDFEEWNLLKKEVNDALEKRDSKIKELEFKLNMKPSQHSLKTIESVMQIKDNLERLCAIEHLLGYGEGKSEGTHIVDTPTRLVLEGERDKIKTGIQSTFEKIRTITVDEFVKCITTDWEGMYSYGSVRNLQRLLTGGTLQ